MRIRLHSGLLTALGLGLGGLSALALPVVAGADGGQVCEGIVIDDGSGSTPMQQTTKVDPGASDLDALSAAGDSFNANNAGLICVVDNYPADGLDNCLSAKHGQFYYWSYWQGNPVSNTWTYANDGPASHTVSAGQEYVEGWRYQDPGPDNPTAPPPGVSPAAAYAACTSIPVTTTSAPGSGGGGSAGGGPGGTIPITGSSPPASASTSPTSTPAAPRTAATAHGVTTTTAKGERGPVSTSAASGSSTTSTTTAGGTPNTSRPGPTKLAESPTSSHSSGGNPALPIIIVAAVIVLLGGATWLLWRRRPAEE